jgi:hypothetical protein
LRPHIGLLRVDDKKELSNPPRIQEKEFKEPERISPASAANRALATLSDRILDDIGQSRDSFAKNVVASVRKELDREDREAAAKKLAKNYHKNFGTKPVTANVNPNLVGAV